MTRRSELAICAYTLALVLLGFVQLMHNLDGVDIIATPATPVMMASEGAPHR